MRAAANAMVSSVEHQPTKLPSRCVLASGDDCTFPAVLITEGGPTSVAIRKGEQWNCINPACNGEVFVIASSEWEGGVNPRCSCGSVMKQPYSRPALKTYPATAEARKRVEIPPGLSLEELGYQHERKYKN
jgi:hypothetical protein